MAKYFVWVCDKCGENKSQRNDMFPEKWVEASVVLDWRFQTKTTVSKIWCEACWKDISAETPKNKVVAA